MQDLRTGEIKELNPNFMLDNPKEHKNFKSRIAELMRDPAFRQKAGEDAGIPAVAQGAVFEIGELVEIKGGRFRVRGFEGGLLHLQGLPSTNTNQTGPRSVASTKAAVGIR